MMVETGRQALTMLKETDVDCIVMDWELPEMDGLTITRIIREMEHTGRLVHRSSLWRRKHSPTSSPISRIPIIGMTAHVLPEHGQQCLMSGMDECLFKPIHLHDFEKVLQRWVGLRPFRTKNPSSGQEYQSWTDNKGAFILPAGEINGIGRPIEGSAEQESYIVSSALDALEGDKALLYSLFEIFNDTAPSVLQAMQISIQMNDRQNLQRQAHQIKGALNAVHAVHEAKMAEQLETRASFAAFSHLVLEMAKLKDVTQHLIGVFKILLANRGSIDRELSNNTCHEGNTQDEQSHDEYRREEEKPF
jgi:CheY-like chemotaxis protein